MGQSRPRGVSQLHPEPSRRHTHPPANGPRHQPGWASVEPLRAHQQRLGEPPASKLAQISVSPVHARRCQSELRSSPVACIDLSDDTLIGINSPQYFFYVGCVCLSQDFYAPCDGQITSCSLGAHSPPPPRPGCPSLFAPPPSQCQPEQGAALSPPFYSTQVGPHRRHG